MDRSRASGRPPPIDLDRAPSHELERAAAAVLPPDVYGFFATGARDERTLAENEAAWAAWWFRPQRLSGIVDVSMTTTLLGREVAHPVVVAPSAGHRLAHPDGELATARAVASFGGVLILSTSTTTTVEEVAAVPGLDLWFQLYPFEDRAMTDALVQRAVAAGARAIVLTVDVTTEADPHARPAGGFRPPATIHWAHHDGRSAILRRLDWGFVARLRDVAGVPVVLKGVLHPHDAQRAIDEGVSAIVVSNHGGRFLDGSIPTALALPDVTAAAAGRIEVYVDGGIRRGGDILRALALGARAALVGRPVLWGLALAGEDGVRRVLGRLVRELREDALLADVADVTAVPRELLVRRDGP